MKDEADLEAVKGVLQAVYPLLREAFKHFAVAGDGDCFAISFNEFTDFRRVSVASWDFHCSSAHDQLAWLCDCATVLAHQRAFTNGFLCGCCSELG